MLYGNGPGALLKIRDYNLTDEQVQNPEYQHESAVYLESETHGGEDVPIYASGPMSFLLSGTVEQSYIAHAMAYSACIYPYNNTDCRKNRGVYASYKNTSNTNSVVGILVYFNILLIVFIFKL